MIIVRYADDVVVGFERASDASRFLDAMRARLEGFGLSLHPDKTRLIEFGRYAAERRKKKGLPKKRQASLTNSRWAAGSGAWRGYRSCWHTVWAENRDSAKTGDAATTRYFRRLNRAKRCYQTPFIEPDSSGGGQKPARRIKNVWAIFLWIDLSRRCVMARPTEQRTLHFALPFLPDGREARLHVSTARHVLQRHTPGTLTAARRDNKALRQLPDHLVTHFVAGLMLPSDAAQLLLVSTPSLVPGARLPTLLLTKIHTPRAELRAALRRHYDHGPIFRRPHPALLMAGVPDPGTDPDLPPDVDDWTSAMDAAVQSVFQHGELLNTAAAASATVKAIITYSNGISDLATNICEQAMAHQGDPTQPNWVIETPYSNLDGTPSATSRYVWSDTTRIWMPGPMGDSLRQVKNDTTLRSSATVAGNYVVQQGVTAVGGAATKERLRGTSLATASADQQWTVNNLAPLAGFTYNNDLAVSGGTLTASFTNSFLRWLSGYVEFLGPDGQPVVPEGWTSQLNPGLAQIYDSDTRKYVALFSSVNTICAVPLGADPTTISFPWPANAAGVRFLNGGIGRSDLVSGDNGTYNGSWDSQICAAGAMMTGIFCLGLPTVLLVTGAVIGQSEMEDLGKSCIGIALDLGGVVLNSAVNGTLGGGDMASIVEEFADAIPHLLLDAPDLVLAINAAVAEEAVEESTPFFGWIALGFSILTTVAALVETTVEILLSPAVFRLDATRAVDATWTLLPDPGHKEWPLEATHYTATATFSDGTTTRAASGDVPTAPSSAPIIVSFNAAGKNQLPGGGTVSFSASFYSAASWLCGSAASQPVTIDINSDTVVVPQQAIVENVIPLSASTRYLYGKSLTFDPGTSRHIWADARPTATIGALNPSNIGNNIGALGQITVNEPQNQVGYSWQASGQNIPLGGGNAPSNNQMYTFQTISTQSDPEAGLRFVPSGFTSSAPIEYDLQGTANGNHFYLDSTGSSYVLRKLALDRTSGTFTLPTGVAWGRFNQPIDACIVHPSGAVVGINTTNARFEVLTLPAASGPDAKAPLAEIHGGYGSRPGLLHRPVGVAPAVGSGVMILENADQTLSPPAPARMQAFDLYGNPAPIFANDATEAPVRTEAGPVTCLAIATEAKGFIYVLKYTGNGGEPAQYLLDLYSPDGTFLSQTAGLPAGGIAVDPWRTLYTLDFAAIAKPAGGRTEPSVSFWTPTTP
jgi:hypothetical protein